MTEPAPDESQQYPFYTLAHWRAHLAQRENQFFLALTILIGALAGLAVVAFILVTERPGARLLPPGVGRLRSALAPMIGSLVIGYVPLPPQIISEHDITANKLAYNDSLTPPEVKI